MHRLEAPAAPSADCLAGFALDDPRGHGLAYSCTDCAHGCADCSAVYLADVSPRAGAWGRFHQQLHLQARRQQLRVMHQAGNVSSYAGSNNWARG